MMDGWRDGLMDGRKDRQTTMLLITHCRISMRKLYVVDSNIFKSKIQIKHVMELP
jgi:hypothetical protein